MKPFLAVVLTSCIALSGLANAGASCSKGKKTASDRSCHAGKSAKGKHCGGCGMLAKGNASLREAAADIEVIQTKHGYIVLATANSSDAIANVRAINAARLRALRNTDKAAGKKACKDCDAFSQALKANAIQLQEVEVSNGVMTVYTASTRDAEKLLKDCCGAFWGPKAEGRSDKKTS